MMTKERLKAYRSQLYEIRQLRSQLADLEARMYSPRGQSLTGMPSGGGSGRSIEDITASHVRLTELYKQKLYALETEQKAVEDAIDSLEPVERTVLRHRYIEGLTWEEIEKRMFFYSSHLRRIHNRAIEKLQ